MTRHPLCKRVAYTDGVERFADTYRAYWLLDKICFSGFYAKSQVWEITPDAITVEDGDDSEVLRIEHVNTGLSITLWFIDNVIMLPSEY